MIIRVDANYRIHIEEPSNFRKFKVACDLAESHYPDVAGANPSALTFDDGKTAWVSIAALRNWDGLAGDLAWQDGLSAMITAATPHGWISADGRTIRAHVEWVG